MKLLIVESPTKAKTITKYLGTQFEVRASVGHIRDLPKSNKNAIDIPGGFVPSYEISKDKKAVVEELQELSKKATEIILATDPDREGEAIAWHITQAIKIKEKKSKPNTPRYTRIAFHEITKDAILEALEHPRDIDINLVKAQEARRVLDRLFGYDLSGLIWKKLRYGLSAGRVQSPALRILVEREKEIKAFVPEPFWVITATGTTDKKNTIPFTCSIEPDTQEIADTIVSHVQNDIWHIQALTATETHRSPRAPFTTSTLQQSASSRLGYAPSITMRLAQKLYEAGLITYMRTDSTTISTQAQQDVLSYISKTYGTSYVLPRVYTTKIKNAQEAHEAIRPTNISVRNAGGSAQEKKVYELIRTRTLASQMSDARMEKTKIIAVCVHADIPTFIAHGSHILFDGWLKADPTSREEDTELPLVHEKDAVSFSDIIAEHKETEPPRRYSEAGLIKELEKRGIGRPSTYATIIKTIIDRGYVLSENRSLRPTDTGEVVSDFLQKYFASYISDSFTAEMENELDEIANGTREYKQTLEKFYTPFTRDVTANNAIPKITNLGSAPETILCPLCGGSMIIKLGRSGKFYSCTKFPDCVGALTLEGKVLEAPKEIGEACPQCKNGKLVEREGKYGMFISCNTYPKCKFIKKDETIPEKNNTGVMCPTCKKGTLVERRGRFGIFYSCSLYPDCKYIIKSKPTGNTCSICNSLMMEGTKTIPERCSNKVCLNHNPHLKNKKSLPKKTRLTINTKQAKE
ncbi:MAG: type I DNA topoisomerase [Candidatus Paceibacterota bacterium]